MIKIYFVGVLLLCFSLASCIGNMNHMHSSKMQSDISIQQERKRLGIHPMDPRLPSSSWQIPKSIPPFPYTAEEAKKLGFIIIEELKK